MSNLKFWWRPKQILSWHFMFEFLVFLSVGQRSLKRQVQCVFRERSFSSLLGECPNLLVSGKLLTPRRYAPSCQVSLHSSEGFSDSHLFCMGYRSIFKASTWNRGETEREIALYSSGLRYESSHQRRALGLVLSRCQDWYKSLALKGMIKCFISPWTLAVGQNTGCIWLGRMEARLGAFCSAGFSYNFSRSDSLSRGSWI